MKRAIALIISVLVMAAIFMKVNTKELASTLASMDRVYFTLAMLAFIPQIWITSFRWKCMTELNRKTISLGESVKLNLSASSMNIFLPSKMGDFAKAYFLKREGHTHLKRGTNMVLFERYMDMTALGIVILIGILFSFKIDEANLFGLAFSAGTLSVFPLLYFVNLRVLLHRPIFDQNKIISKIKHFLLDAQDYLEELKKAPASLIFLFFLSLFLWFLHLLQFYAVFLALHSQVSIFHVFRLVPLAILVGLLPVTVAGVGTRDSALIYFFAPYETMARMVGVGLFASLRYLVPGLLGLPFLNAYILKTPVPE